MKTCVIISSKPFSPHAKSFMLKFPWFTPDDEPWIFFITYQQNFQMLPKTNIFWIIFCKSCRNCAEPPGPPKDIPKPFWLIWDWFPILIRGDCEFWDVKLTLAWIRKKIRFRDIIYKIINVFLNFSGWRSQLETLHHFLRISTNCISRLVSSLFWIFEARNLIPVCLRDLKNWYF